MKHYFQSMFGTKICKTCKKVESEHFEIASCESCNRAPEPCRYNEDEILMCESCLKRDIEIKSELSAAKVSEETIATEPLSELAAAIQIDNNLTTSQDFFNAETVSMVELEQIIARDTTVADDQKHFKFVEVIRERHKMFRQKLFEVKQLEVEILSRERAMQYRLNDIASKFRLDEREKLKLQDLSYTPKEVATKAPKIKMTMEDKLIENYARLMKVTVEQAKTMFRNKMKEVRSSNE